MKRKIEIEVMVIDKLMIPADELESKIKEMYEEQGETPIQCNSCGWVTTEAEEIKEYKNAEINYCIKCNGFLCGLCTKNVVETIFLCGICNNRKK